MSYDLLIPVAWTVCGGVVAALAGPNAVRAVRARVRAGRAVKPAPAPAVVVSPVPGPRPQTMRAAGTPGGAGSGPARGRAVAHRS